MICVQCVTRACCSQPTRHQKSLLTTFRCVGFIKKNVEFALLLKCSLTAVTTVSQVGWNCLTVCHFICLSDKATFEKNSDNQVPNYSGYQCMVLFHICSRNSTVIFWCWFLVPFSWTSVMVKFAQKGAVNFHKETVVKW